MAKQEKQTEKEKAQARKRMAYQDSDLDSIESVKYEDLSDEQRLIYDSTEPQLK